jgi:hypothetical protein
MIATDDLLVVKATFFDQVGKCVSTSNIFGVERNEIVGGRRQRHI